MDDSDGTSPVSRADMAESIQCYAFSASVPRSRHCSLAQPSRSVFFSRMRRRLQAAPDSWDGMIKLEEEEASTLIDMCRDLDWESCVDALRREAMRMSDAAKKEARMPQLGGVGSTNGDQWDYKEAVMDLRRRASLKAAEEMAKVINPADYTQTVSKLAQDILNACEQLMQDESSSGGNGSTNPAAAPSFLLATLAGLHGLFSFSAAADEIQAAQDKVPSWLPPAILGFPVASYLVFSVYRDKVDPRANLMDFFFALVAMFIVGNLVTSATLGVRLY